MREKYDWVNRVVDVGLAEKNSDGHKFENHKKCRRRPVATTRMK